MKREILHLHNRKQFFVADCSLALMITLMWTARCGVPLQCRPQRRQKQKAQQRLGVYGSYLARGQYTREEEHQDDGDYRERLSAAELRKRKAEREAKEKEERELEDKAKQDSADLRPSKKVHKR
jgi:hypothetical protein